MKFESDEFKIRRSLEAILRNQDVSGAIIASPDFTEYHYSWLRDSSFCSYALDRGGEHEASARYHAWVNDAVTGIAGVIDAAIAGHERGEPLNPLHMPPARFALDGATVGDDWPNFQIDGYGTWLWALGKHLELTGRTSVPPELLDSVTRVARYLVAFALTPCYDVWEENGDALHTSTLACVYGGLMTASRLLGDSAFAEAAADVREKVIADANRVGYYVKSSTNEDVDASLLWLTSPFGLVDHEDEYFAKTVALIEARLSLDGGIRRYSTDVYYGSGAWPVLTCSLGWHDAALGDLSSAAQRRDAVSALFDDQGRLGEQFGGDERDPDNYQAWLERWGHPARDLTWSHAMYAILCLAIDEHAASDATGQLRHTVNKGGAKRMSL